MWRPLLASGSRIALGVDGVAHQTTAIATAAIPKTADNQFLFWYWQWADFTAHPWQHDNSELVARYRAKFEQGYGNVVTVVASA